MKNSRFAVTTSIAILLCIGGRLHGQSPAAAFPWLHEGTVLTYSRHAAVVPGKPYLWKQDEHGDWIDPRTGKSYDRYTRYGTSGNMLGQVTVLAIDGNSVALGATSF